MRRSRAGELQRGYRAGQIKAVQIKGLTMIQLRAALKGRPGPGRFGWMQLDGIRESQKEFWKLWREGFTSDRVKLETWQIQAVLQR